MVDNILKMRPECPVEVGVVRESEKGLGDRETTAARPEAAAAVPGFLLSLVEANVTSSLGVM